MTRGHQFPANVFNCDVASERLFAGLSSDAQRDLSSIQTVSDLPRGATLFEEGELSSGIFILASGSAQLSISSSRGERVALRTARPGEVLGLSATVSGKTHEVTAQTTAPARVVFIRRKDFVRYLREHSDFCMHVVHSLSNDVQAAYARVRALGMARERHSRN